MDPVYRWNHPVSMLSGFDVESRLGVPKATPKEATPKTYSVSDNVVAA